MNSAGSTPEGWEIASATTTVGPTATTFSFGNLSHTYNGSTKTATVTPSPSNATYSSDLTKGPNAGTYTVSATANGNFSGSGSATLTINKANQATLTLSAATSQQYGTSQTLSASGGSGGGAVSYAIAGQSAGGNASLSGATLTANASSGWVDVRASKAADTNYNAANSSTIRINLSPRPTTFSFGNLSHTYNGSTKTATVTPSPGGATFGSDLTKGPNAGSYTVSATANGNYSGSGSATLTINKANQAALALNVNTSQQYGTNQTLSASGGSGGGAVSYVITGQSAGGNASLSGATLTANASSGWVDVRADKAADSNYNAISSSVVRVNLSPHSATFSFGNLTHTYNGSTKTATVTPSPSNATYGSDLTKGPGAGTYTVSATANGNFSGSGSATLTINKASQATLTLSASTSQQYGTSQTLSASGGSGGGAVSYVITNWSSANNASLSGATLTANASSGWVDVRADKAADTNYNATSSTVVRVNLGAHTTTFSFGNLTHTYNGSTKTATVTPSPSNATYSSDLTKGPNAGTYTVSATANGNFSGSGSTTLTISKANQATLTLSASTSQEYDTSQTLSASGGSGGGAVSYVITGQSAGGNASLSGAELTANASSGWVDVRADKAADTNYNASSSNVVRVNLAQRVTTFALSQPSFTYDGSLKEVTIVPTPENATFTSGGTLSATDVDDDYTATATATGHYSGSNSSLQWSIAIGSQTIIFDNPGPQTFGTPFNLDATATSELTVSFTVASGPASISGNNIVSFSGTGEVTITASQGGDSNYGAAPNVNQTFTVNKGNQSINFPPPGTQTFGTPYNLNATASSDLGVTYVVTSGPASISGNAVIFNGTGSVTITASQSGDTNWNAATPVPRTFEVIRGNQSINFPPPGTQTFGTPYNLNATASSDLGVTYVVTSGPASISGNTVIFNGTGSVTITASQSGDTNWNAATPVPRTFGVNKAAPTANFPSPRTLGAQSPTHYTVQAGDLNASFTGPSGYAAPTGAITYTVVGPGTTVTAGTQLPLSTYTIQASYQGDDNYLATTRNATWTVTEHSDGDNVPDYIEVELGTNPNSTNATDTGAANSLKVHQPN